MGTIKLNGITEKERNKKAVENAACKLMETSGGFAEELKELCGESVSA